MAVMNAYEYFGLSRAPFENVPDPRFFHPLSVHAETLATLQYAIHAGKACTIVLGESGSGKTLLGRILAQNVGSKTGVLWIHGIGQPPDATDVTVCPRGLLENPAAFRDRKVQEHTLGGWIRQALPAAQATVVVIDNADALRPHCWEDVLSLVTREIRTPRPISVILMGLPDLLDTLAAPPLVRLQRRVFRICRLRPMSREESAAYVRHRLEAAGHKNGDIFNAPALSLLHRVTGGNPALLNQLCDNAMLEAFGDDRQEIQARHIVATLQAVTGGPPESRSLPAPPSVAVAEAAAVFESPDAGPHDQPRVMAKNHPATRALLPMATEPSPYPNLHAVEHSTVMRPHIPADRRRVIIEPATDSIEPDCENLTVLDDPDAPLGTRLSVLEQRLSQVLERVQAARAQAVGTEPPNAERTNLPEPPPVEAGLIEDPVVAEQSVEAASDSDFLEPVQAAAASENSSH